MKYILLGLIFSLFLAQSCSKKVDPSPTIVSDQMFFPDIAGNNWETKTISSLGWKESAVQPLKDFLV